MIDILISRNANGTIGLATTSGTVLLDSSLRELEYSAPGTVTAEVLFNPIQIWRIDNLSGQRVGTARDFDHQISSGKLRGLLDLRDDELRDLSLTLGELSATVIDQINAIHNAHTSVPPPNQLTGRSTVIGVSGLQDFFTGITTFAVVDANNQLVNRVTIDFGVTTTFTDILTAVNAGLGADGTLTLVNGVMEFTATDPTHGVVLADDPASPSSRGGQSFSQYFAMNNLLQAAVPTNYNTGYGATAGHNIVAGGLVTFGITGSDGKVLTQYTLDPAVAGPSYLSLLNDLNTPGALGNFVTFSMDALGAIVVTPNAGSEGIRLTVISDTTDTLGSGISFTALFGIGDRYLVDASKNVKIRDSISQQPANMAMASFDLTAAIGTIALSEGDQSGATTLFVEPIFRLLSTMLKRSWRGLKGVLEAYALLYRWLLGPKPEV